MSSALLTPAQAAAAAAADRRKWRVDAVVLGLAALLLRLPALFASRSLVFDDGVFATSALAMRAGELPFRDVFSSQGPLFLPLVFVGDLVGLRTLDAPRVLAVASGVVVTVATYACARRLTTRANALLAAGLVTTSGSVLWVTGPINADGPALALSMLAVAVALRYRAEPRTVDAVLVGLAGGAAMSVKPLAGPAVLVAWLVVVTIGRRGLDAFASALVAGAVYVVTALPWGISRVWEQSVRYHAEADRVETGPGALATLLHTLWERDLVLLVALALAGGTWLLRRTVLADGQPHAPSDDALVLEVAALSLWALLVVALLVWEPAMWRAHVAHLVPPLALLASLRPPPWQVLAVAGIVVAPLWLALHDDILLPSGYSGDTAAVVTRLRSFPDHALLISDDPGLVWRSGHRPPPGLVDPSFQRIDRGDITARTVAREAAGVEVCGVVVTSAQRLGRFASLPGRLASEGYLPERFGPQTTLYTRPGCDPA